MFTAAKGDHRPGVARAEGGHVVEARNRLQVELGQGRPHVNLGLRGHALLVQRLRRMGKQVLTQGGDVGRRERETRSKRMAAKMIEPRRTTAQRLVDVKRGGAARRTPRDIIAQRN